MEKQRWEEPGRTRAEERTTEERKNDKKEDAGARKGRQDAMNCVFPTTCGEKLREAHPQVKMGKAHHSRTTFGS